MKGIIVTFACFFWTVHGFFHPAPTNTLASSTNTAPTTTIGAAAFGRVLPVVAVVHAHSSVPLQPARFGSTTTLKKKKGLFDLKIVNARDSRRRGFILTKTKNDNKPVVLVGGVAAKNDSNNSNNNNNNTNMFRITRSVPAATVAVAIWTIFICAHYQPNAALVVPSTLNQMAGFWFNLQSAFWSYCHLASILVICASLVAERCWIREYMSVQDENRVVDIDLIFGLAGILLVGSGFVRAIHYGQGGDYYVHDVVFWIKMCLAGIWGGMTLFPSIIFYRRKKERHDIDNVHNNNNNSSSINSNNNGIRNLLLSQQQQQQRQAPISPALAKKLHKTINAEISAILFIPLLGSLMRRGVFHESCPNFLITRHPIIGIVTSIALTIAANIFYARKALTWKEPEESS